MILFFNASGTINIDGCGEIEKRINVGYKWGERSVVYVKPKAVQGVFEKVAIKKVFMNNFHGNLEPYAPVYQDTLNSLYNEDELINEYEAIELVQQYIDRRKNLLAQAKNRCSGNTI